MKTLKAKIIAVLVLILVIASAVLFSLNRKHKAESTVRVNDIITLTDPMKKDLMDLYQKRQELLETWMKAASPKAAKNTPTSEKIELMTEKDFQNYDMFQTEISNQFSALLTQPMFMKRIKELEVIEHQINKKRNEYSELANEADTLIKKYNTGQKEILMFPAEKLLFQMKKK
jgi:hypothetical protein